MGFPFHVSLTHMPSFYRKLLHERKTSQDAINASRDGIYFDKIRGTTRIEQSRLPPCSPETIPLSRM